MLSYLSLSISCVNDKERSGKKLRVHDHIGRVRAEMNASPSLSSEQLENP